MNAFSSAQATTDHDPVADYPVLERELGPSLPSFGISPTSSSSTRSIFRRRPSSRPAVRWRARGHSHFGILPAGIGLSDFALGFRTSIVSAALPRWPPRGRVLSVARLHRGAPERVTRASVAPRNCHPPTRASKGVSRRRGAPSSRVRHRSSTAPRTNPSAW